MASQVIQMIHSVFCQCSLSTAWFTVLLHTNNCGFVMSMNYTNKSATKRRRMTRITTVRAFTFTGKQSFDAVRIRMWNAYCTRPLCNLSLSASLFVCTLQQVLFNNSLEGTCPVRMWRWQMSNYRGDIHASRLWPAWPAISPAGADWETRELRLSIQAPGKAAGPILAHHPSPVPLGCHSCVTVPSFTDQWPHWGRSRMIKYLYGIKDNHLASLTKQRKKNFPHILYHSDIFSKK